MKSEKKQLQELLEEKYRLYNRIDFISSDPISIPHLFSKKADIEIAGFLSATIAWGQRTTIINNGKRLMQLMNHQPHEFVLNFTENKKTYLQLKSFVHRTFNGDDLIYFLLALQNIYRHHKDMESLFLLGYNKNETDLKNAIIKFRDQFFQLPYPTRTLKHFSNPAANSATKRINMFLRWMVRKDNEGVDFGLWNHIPASVLSCPLDVHSGNVARKMGLLLRKQNDWKATAELTAALKEFDPLDPVKFDFALFGLGVFEGY